MMIMFKVNDEAVLGKETFAVLWDGLTLELNQLGPPTRTSSQWKKVWTEYRYNHDGRRSTTKTTVSSNIYRSFSDQGSSSIRTGNLHFHISWSCYII